MKRKLLIALLATAAVAGLLAGNVAADDTWGTGGWDVPKQRTAWNPDGVWMEGEYYKVDLSSQPEGTVNYHAWDESVDRDYVKNFDFGMSWDEEYLYTFIMYEGGYTYGSQVWDGCCIQFSGTDYGAEGGDNRLEYGVTWNAKEDCNETCNWYDWLNAGYGNGTNTDDFAVFIREGWIVYEMRTPFSAFTTATVAEDAKMGVCYVIGAGNGDGQRIQTQIGNGVAVYKDAKDHCPITLVAEQSAPEQNYIDSDDTLTLTAVYADAGDVLYSGTVGEDNIPWQITADGTLTVGTVDGEGSYSIPDWDSPWNYDDDDNVIAEAIANGKLAPWLPYRGEVTNIVIGDDINCIGDYSFWHCYEVQELTIPGTVKIVGNSAFRNCDGLVSLTIEEGVEELQTNAFDSCPKLTTVDIPASVTYFSSAVFNWCDDLYAINIDKDNKNYVSIDGVVYTSDMTELLRYPIAKNDVSSYTVPNTVKVIWNDCFECVSALTSITLPDGLEEIGFYGLSYMDNLTSITIPASVNHMEFDVFYNDTSLTDVYFLGNRPNHWGDNIFYGDDGHLSTTIHYPASAEGWGDITGEYGNYMEVNGGYKVRFVDDDGVTDVADEQILDLNEAIAVPNSPDHSDYGTFQQWFAQNRDYTITDTALTLTQALLDDAAQDTNDDGINDTIVFEAEYELLENVRDYRAEGYIDTDNDGKNDIHWSVEWNRNLTVESTSDNMVSIPDYPDCYADTNAERAPWHEYASYIRSMNIYNNINAVGQYAFADLWMLEHIDIPGDVKTIGNCAFIGCTNVGGIDIRDGVENIYHDVFCSVDMNNGIWIPASVTYLDDQAFISCRVNQFEVDENNQTYWSDEQGILYKHNGDGTSTLLVYPKNNGVQAVVIPEGVTTIHESAFEDVGDIYSIQFPESLQTIEKYAFRSMGNLRFQYIPASVTSIGDEAFANCWSLDRVFFYGDLPTLGNNMFTNASVAYLEENKGTGFETITEYETVNYGETFGNIVGGYNEGWWNDKYVKLSWNIDLDGTLTVSELNGANVIPDDYHPWWYAQAYVRKVDIDDSITYIGNSAFCGLTHVDTINLPAKLEYVGRDAFNADGRSGNNLGHLILPGKVEEICNWAFFSLGITKVTIPASLNYIESGWAFADNPITTYAVESGSTNFAVDSYGALYELDNSGNYVALVAYPRDAEYTSYTVPNGVTKLHGAAFRNACNLTSITLPDTLEEIGNEAFAHFYNDLRTLTIPASVKTIYSNAFRWGDKSYIVFEGDMPEFINDGEGDGNQFWDNRDGFSLYYYEGAAGWDSYTAIDTVMLKAGEDPYLAHGSFKNGDDTIYWNINQAGVLTVSGSGNIPDYYNDYSWRNHMDLVKEIVIEEGITGIGGRMFENGSGITSLTLPSTLTYINENAFYSGDGNNFGEVTIPASVKWLNYHAFDGCGITKVTLAGTMEEWDSEAFWNNPITAYAVTADNAYYTTVDGVLFNPDKTELVRYPVGRTDSSYTVPDGVKVLKDCFYWAKNLTSVTLPNGLETIEWNAFANSGLTMVTIPASVNDVKDSAFCNCYDLTDVYFLNKRPDNWEGNLFWLYDEDGNSYLREDFKIHYPAASANWRNVVNEYGDHIELTYGYLVQFADDDGATGVIDPYILNIGDSFNVPTAETKDYGSFKHWFAWNSDYTTTDASLTLTKDFINATAFDNNDDGLVDTIVFEAEYERYDSAGENRVEEWIDTNGDGTNEIHWYVTWDRTLVVETALNDQSVAIPNYDTEDNRAPWHAYANYIRGLNLWNGIDSIGNCAFADLYLLDGFDIPGDVKYVGLCAFINCTNVGWININDGVETIEHDAFCSIDMNNQLWIPASVKTINDNAFLGLRVNNYDVDENNPNYWSDEQGILYKHNGNGMSTLLSMPKNRGMGAVVIPEGVTTIHESAFEWANDLHSVQLPETLTTIEKYAFKSLDIHIIHIPASVTSIGEEAFQDNGNLYGAYFYGNAPAMGDGVFNDCNNEFQIYSLSGKTGFDGMGYNTDTFNANDNYAEGTISYNWNGENISLTWEITKEGWLNVEGATSIPDNEHPWWNYFAYVRKVDIDDRITYIGNNAFSGLVYVDQINLPKNLITVGDSAFSGDVGNSLGHWILPGKVETIYNNAFGNLGLTKVTIPASLKDIRSWVFTDNPITTYAVENGSTNFGVDSYGALYELDENGNYVALVAYPRDAKATSYTVPNGVTKLYGAAIRNCDNLTEVILPNTLKVLENEAFCHSHNLGQLTIPASVTDVWTYAFGSTGVPSILFMGDKPTFHDDGEYEGNQFNGWGDDVYTIFYYEGATGWDSYTAVRTVALKAGEEPMLVVGHVDNTDIDWNIDKNGVLTVYGEGDIPDYTWEWREYIDTMVKKIHIEEGITGIGHSSFWNDNGGITELTLPSTLKYINTNAFVSNGENGNKFGELVLPEGLERIDYHAFYNCGLTKVTIPSTMTRLDSWAFEKNQVKEYVVAKGNTEYATDDYGVLFELYYDEDDNGNRIEGTARLGAVKAYPSGSSMTSYTIPETVGDIWSCAFYEANNLTKLNLNHVWGYSNYGIAYCDNLTTLVLPENISWMDPDAIIGNKNLKSITFAGRIPWFNEWDDGKFDPFVDNADDLTIYYYEGAEAVENLQNNNLINQHNFVMLTHTNLKGDIFDDGKVDNDDLQALVDYFSGKDIGYFNKDNADIDGDGNFTRRDVMILARYLDNWEGYADYFN